MARRLLRVCLLLGMILAGGSASRAQPGEGLFLARPNHWQRLQTAALVPVEQLPSEVRERVRQTLEHPTLFASGPAEAFPCQPALYTWLLDHPDRGVLAWRRLGAVCLDIRERQPGRFGWADDQGNDLWWETVYHSSDLRIWYAEGKVKPSAMLPAVPVQAVVVLRQSLLRNPQGGTVLLCHQADLFLHTDSKTAALVTRLLGPSATRLAEQALGQMQFFFSALASYCQRHPEQVDYLLAPP
jgi:hypothetical protein